MSGIPRWVAVVRSAFSSKYESRPSGRVEDQLDLAVLHQVDDVRAAPRAPCRRERTAIVASKKRRGAARGDEREAQSRRGRARSAAASLSLSFTETNAVPASGTPSPAADLGLGEGGAEVVGDAHHLAGPAHLGPSTGSSPGNLTNGKTDSLTKRPSRRGLGGEPQLGQRSPDHHLRRDLGERHAGRLGHERHGAAGARVDLEHVDHAVLDRVLHVHQAAHARAPAPAARCSRAARPGCSMTAGMERRETQAESPEWIPASSMCCMIPPITTRVPSASASTSTSKASSRKRSSRTGCSGEASSARRIVSASRLLVVA